MTEPVYLSPLHIHGLTQLSAAKQVLTASFHEQAERAAEATAKVSQDLPPGMNVVSRFHDSIVVEIDPSIEIDVALDRLMGQMTGLFDLDTIPLHIEGPMTYLPHMGLDTLLGQMTAMHNLDLVDDKTMTERIRSLSIPTALYLRARVEFEKAGLDTATVYMAEHDPSLDGLDQVRAALDVLDVVFICDRHEATRVSAARLPRIMEGFEGAVIHVDHPSWCENNALSTVIPTWTSDTWAYYLEFGTTPGFALPGLQEALGL